MGADDGRPPCAEEEEEEAEPNDDECDDDADAKRRDSGAGASVHTTFSPVTVIAQDELATCPVSGAERGELGLEVIVFRLPAGSGVSIIREVVEAVVSKC